MKKYKNENQYINAFKKFLKTGILPVLFLLLTFWGCYHNISKNNSDSTTYTNSNITTYTNGNNDIYTDTSNITIEPDYFGEYQYNDILMDTVNDKKLMEMDTTLYFSDLRNLYEITIKHKQIQLSIGNWKYVADAEDGTPSPNWHTTEGFQKDGFIYLKKYRSDGFELYGKILLGKGLFVWEDIHWYLINAGDI